MSLLKPIYMEISVAGTYKILITSFKAVHALKHCQPDYVDARRNKLELELLDR